MIIKRLIILLLLLTIPTISLAEVGKASYYGKRFHGKLTASGEKFNMFELTAAHRTIKFGRYVKVTNLLNNKLVIVKINDRGPFIKGRIIDLSKAAAKEIDLTNVSNVEIEVI